MSIGVRGSIFRVKGDGSSLRDEAAVKFGHNRFACKHYAMINEGP